MSVRSLRLSDAVNDELKKQVKASEHKTVDAFLSSLFFPNLADSEGAPSSSSEESGGEAPQKKRKKNVREPLFSFEDLAERDKMLEYYTGFDESAIRLLIRRLGEVGKPFFFSFFFLFSSPATMLPFYATKPPCFFR